MSYVYLYVKGFKGDPSTYTVGFYDPQGHWHAESDHALAESAARRTAWLNGSGSNHFNGLFAKPTASTAED